MTSEELLTTTAVKSWKMIVDRTNAVVSEVDDEHLEREVAPGRNRLRYLLGHLTAVHDKMLPLLGLGERLHPELDQAYLDNSDKTFADPISCADLKRAWRQVNDKLSAAFEAFTPKQWLEKHTAVSEADFVKDPARNRLAVLLSRTNHLSYHSGQMSLARE